MEKLLISLAITCWTGLLKAQDKAKIDTFGRQMYSIIKSLDTIRLSDFLPSKQDLLEYMESSTMTNEAKKDFLKTIDSGLEEMNKVINKNVIKTHNRAIEEGVVWENTKYSITEIDYWPKEVETKYKPIKISIYFTYYGVKFRVATHCIMTTKGTIMLMDEFVWRTN